MALSTHYSNKIVGPLGKVNPLYSASDFSYISYINQDALHQRKETTRQHKRHKKEHVLCFSIE